MILRALIEHLVALFIIHVYVIRVHFLNLHTKHTVVLLHNAFLKLLVVVVLELS
jgi:hypothetical protein